MIIGIGTDILDIDDLHDEYLHEGDAFFESTFTTDEKKEALKRQNPKYYFATRFSGKEAIFKALRRSSKGFRLNQIEILNDEDGKPFVNLYGDSLIKAKEKGIDKIHISLSYDKKYALAYAISETYN